jgi:hypothetical protein
MKYSSIFLSAAAGLMCMMAWSCADTLDMAPDGSLSMDDVISDPVKVSALLGSCYKYIPQKGYTYSDWETLLVALSDDGWSTADGFGGLPVNIIYGDRHSTGYHPVRDVDGMSTIEASYNGYQWSRFWGQVFQCNQFLDIIDRAAVNSEEERERFTAEAHLLRAYFYSELLQYFGKLPILDHLTSFEDDFSGYTRRPVKEVVDFIIQDCDFAIDSQNLPWRITVEAEAMRVTKALAWAIKSRMSMFAASPLYCEGEDYWEWAYQINAAAVKALEENGYALFTTCTDPTTFGTGDGAAYRQLQATNHKYSASPEDRETIWEHASGEANHWQWHIGYLGCSENNTAFCGTTPTQELVDAFETTDGKPVLMLDQPYLDTRHLEPNYNPANTLYDPTKPYENRDPRLDATIMHHGSSYRWDGKSKTVNTLYVEGTATGKHAPSLDTSDRTKSRTGYYNCKFLAPNVDGTLTAYYSYNTEGTKRYKSRWKFYRMAEIYLNLAECAEAAGHPNEAVEAVNKVRARVNMPGLSAGDANLKLRIRNERRVELAWEENRYFDLRRWQEPTGNLHETCDWLTGMRPNRIGRTIVYERYNITQSPRGGAENRDLLLPLSTTEAARMESVTGQNWQNPGW